MPTPSKSSRPNFRQRYDALEIRRDALMARLTALAAVSEKARTNPAHGRARTLLNQTFRKSSLAQRTAVLEAADWLIGVLDRASALP